MDVLTRDIWDEINWCMLFLDDIVLMDEMKVGVSAKVGLLRKSLESKGLR